MVIVYELCCGKKKLYKVLQIWWLCLDLSREPMIYSNRVIEESLLKGAFTKVSGGFRESPRDWSMPRATRQELLHP